MSMVILALSTVYRLSLRSTIPHDGVLASPIHFVESPAGRAKRSEHWAPFTDGKRRREREQPYEHQTIFEQKVLEKGCYNKLLLRTFKNRPGRVKGWDCMRENSKRRLLQTLSQPLRIYRIISSENQIVHDNSIFTWAFASQGLRPILTNGNCSNCQPFASRTSRPTLHHIGF